MFVSGACIAVARPGEGHMGEFPGAGLCHASVPACPRRAGMSRLPAGAVDVDPRVPVYGGAKAYDSVLIKFPGTALDRHEHHPTLSVPVRLGQLEDFVHTPGYQ